jgi:hypothetical protein
VTAPTATLPPLPDRAWSGLVRAWERLPLREPWRVLAPLLLAQWIAVCVFAFSVHHNGWLFYQGGDQIWYWTTSWLVGHGLIAKTLISPAWAFLLVPAALVAGPGFISGLPWAILIQALVLGPIGLFCLYDIASRIAGRVVGYIAATLWVIGPYVAIPLFVQRYHDRYVDQFLPHPLGLTGMADFASMVTLLAAGACMVRTYQSRRLEWAVMSGLVAGLAVLTKASNLIFLVAPLVLYLVGRRWRELGAFAVCLLPALAALTLWKYRGYGYLPAFNNAYEPHRLALGSETGSILTPYHRYLELNWSRLQNNLDGTAEVFFSLRVLQFLPFAGAIAVARKAPAMALALSAWFWLYFLIKGSDLVASVDSGSFFRLLLPAIPPLVVMTASLPLLVPRVGPALAARFPAPPPRIPSRRALIACAVLFSLVPFVAAVALRPTRGAGKVVIMNEIAVPVDGSIGLRADVENGEVRLRWAAKNLGSSRVFYRLLRKPTAKDSICIDDEGADKCYYAGRRRMRTRETEVTDRPGRGTFTYRVAVGANWIDNPNLGDVFLVSPPVTVRVP